MATRTPHSLHRGTLVLGFSLVLAAGRPVRSGTFPLETGESVVTCRGGTLGSAPYVLGIVDVRDPGCNSAAALGLHWPAPMYHNEFPNPTSDTADEWTVVNLGQVFGVTLDDARPPNIYVTSTSTYGVGPGTGAVYRIDGASGRIQLLVTLPNTGEGLGNLAYDADHGQLLITNHADGRVYRVDTTGAILGTYDPFAPDTGSPGFAPLGERLWAAAVHEARLYFSVWQEDAGRPHLQLDNTVWSVAIDPGTGALVAGDLTLEITMPPLPPISPVYSNPVSDIAFTDDGRMLLAERSMQTDMQPFAHEARVLEYVGAHLAWTPSPAFFAMGQIQPTSSAGGVDRDCSLADSCNTGKRVWATGDALRLEPGLELYGLQGMPTAGGDWTTSYIIDLDGVFTVRDKTGIGEVDIYRIPCTVTASAGSSQNLCTTGGPVNVVLDASSSIVLDCPSAPEYRWLEGATVVRGWSTDPTANVAPTLSTQYTVEVRCGGCACYGQADVSIALLQGPSAALAPLPAVCIGGPLTLDATGTSPGVCTTGLEYQFRAGATVIRPYGPSPLHGPFPATTSTIYSVDVRCAGNPYCTSTVDAPILVIEPPLAVLLPPGPACNRNHPITLQASGSNPFNCPVPLEYQFLEGATVLRAWAPAPSYGPFVPGPGPFTVEVRCPAVPDGCVASDTQNLVLAAPPSVTVAPVGTICENALVSLDASGSSPGGCPGPLEYRFLSGATVLAPWSPSPIYGPLAPPITGIYTIEARCAALPDCAASILVTLVAVPPPVAAAGVDPTVCAFSPVVLDASASSAPGCPGGALYEWWEGATLRFGPSPVPTWAPPTTVAGTITYTLLVTCPAAPGCTAADDVTVTVSTCVLEVHWGAYRAFPSPDGVTITWTTLAETRTNFFTVERAISAHGPFAVVVPVVESRGSGSSYRVVDATAAPGTLPWYRIVEYTDAGLGSVTAPFRAAPEAGTGRGGGGPRNRGTSTAARAPLKR